MTENKNTTESPSRKLFFYQINHVSQINQNIRPQEVKQPPELNPKDKYAFLFTHPLNKDERSIIQQVKNLIEDAVHNDSYLLASSFILNNNEIVKLIKKAAQRLKGKIYIILGSKLYAYLSFNRANESVNQGFSELTKLGVLVRYMKNAHLKFITSGRKSLICTTNFTTEGLYKNPEFGILLEKENEIKSLNRLFFYLWFRKCESMLVNGNWIEILSDKDHSQFKSLRINQPEIIITSGEIKNDINRDSQVLDETPLFEIMMEQLDLAEKSIDIAIYIFVGLTNMKLNQLIDTIIDKASKQVQVRILVPSVNVNYRTDMRKVLETLKKKGVAIKYYRELHGKCIIVDGKRILMFTGNIDKYLISPDSCDIGWLSEDPFIVKNFCMIYNHLWSEASEERDVDVTIDVHLDLVIKSYELISFRPPISVNILKKIIQESKKIQLFIDGLNALVSIKGQKTLNLFIYLNESDASEFTSGALDLSGILSNKPTLNRKEALTYTVKKLDLKLLWSKK